MPEEGPWYYCLDHKAVEGRDGCSPGSRFGPYPTREAAEHAMEKVAERNEQWERQDREWDNPGSDIS